MITPLALPPRKHKSITKTTKRYIFHLELYIYQYRLSSYTTCYKNILFIYLPESIYSFSTLSIDSLKQRSFSFKSRMALPYNRTRTRNSMQFPDTCPTSPPVNNTIRPQRADFYFTFDDSI